MPWLAPGPRFGHVCFKLMKTLSPIYCQSIYMIPGSILGYLIVVPWWIFLFTSRSHFALLKEPGFIFQCATKNIDFVKLCTRQGLNSKSKVIFTFFSLVNNLPHPSGRNHRLCCSERIKCFSLDEPTLVNSNKPLNGFPWKINKHKIYCDHLTSDTRSCETCLFVAWLTFHF